MPFNTQQFLKLQDQVREREDKAKKAKWELEKQLKELRETYNCETLEQAEGLLAKKQQQLQEAEEAYDVELKKFEEEWGEKLDG